MNTNVKEEYSPKQPPKGVFELVQYKSPVGSLPAYITPDPKDGRKHPAIIWIKGGVCNYVGDFIWKPQRARNDQSAAQYRQKGVVMMFPYLRGGNPGAGQREGFYGEVDDVLAAARYLETRPYVDPKRIYLGGHSTGGTLALLVAEFPNQFRGIFSFGPVKEVLLYGSKSGFLPFDHSNIQEFTLRAPGVWLNSIQNPTWVIEGGSGTNNIDSLQWMGSVNKNPKVKFLEVSNANHFNILQPTNILLAQKILRDSSQSTNILLTEDELTKNMIVQYRISKRLKQY